MIETHDITKTNEKMNFVERNQFELQAARNNNSLSKNSGYF